MGSHPHAPSIEGLQAQNKGHKQTHNRDIDEADDQPPINIEFPAQALDFGSNVVVGTQPKGWGIRRNVSGYPRQTTGLFRLFW